ncbi:MAG TPA: DUF6079 family protein [Pyrinomonadaceae bacterium]
MKRIQEKVKDLVEVRPYRGLYDFLSDSSETLSAYHFTDQTAEMMAKWLDKVADVQPHSGAAKALAGYRGVGKSHFLATLGAIVSHPELRARVTNSLVAASAQRLKRRRHPVAYVRRGTHATLLEELKDALAQAIEVEPTTLGGSLENLLKIASEKAADLPFVIIIDTAHDRANRVSRDDGVLLGELAELAKNLNLFVAVALDDDIAGADGINAAIARNYAIDYLDQEHLYRIVDTHIFPKHRQTQRLVHDIYTYFRGLLPSFRWSEQRFVSLYPLHPLILEIAPFVRLYAPDFALLGFASEAGAKILGRPANSLVGLDEVFDRTEPALRKADDLRDAFMTYDRLSSEVIAHVPVMQRLQAKLVLKALMLLSLDGDGTTASEISAAMLIYDENAPQNSIRQVEDLLETFVSIFPEAVNRREENGRELRYSLKVSSKDSLNIALSEASLGISSDVVPKILRRFAAERFPEWIPPAENEATDSTDCRVVWRGGNRRVRLIWNLREGAAQNSENANFLDWQIVVSQPQNASAAVPAASGKSTIVWQPAPLEREEEEAILRYSILLSDESLRESFGEQVRAAGHTHSRAVEKIWNRVFLEDGRLLIDGFRQEFSEKARVSHSLGEMLSETLTPLFEARYPAHPIFADVLGMNEVSKLVSDLFSGARQTVPEIQQLAASFASPLGLVALRGKNLVLDTEENLLQQPFVQEILALLSASGGETVSLANVSRRLKSEPYGLVAEAQYLILAALVAQRRIEFVTSEGDRINRRSLDLKIVWDDIVGIARPATAQHSSAELTNWARTLTAVDTFKTIDDPEDREKVRKALENWLFDWESASVLERFEQMPEEILNTKIWRLAMRAQKTFGAVAETVREVLQETVSLEDCLQRIADAFSDSEKEFLECTKDLMQLEDFINGAGKREAVWHYLAVCETTQDETIEKLRAKLLEFIREMAIAPSEILNRELERMWLLFHEAFVEHFAIKHDTVMKSHHLLESYDEMMRSDEWWEFENLSSLSIFQKNHWQKAQKICRRFKELDCRSDVRQMLQEHPFCACPFRLSQMKEWENLPRILAETVNQGRRSYRKTLKILSQTLVPLLEYFGDQTKEVEYAEAALKLADIFKEDGEIPLLSTAELIILEKTVKAMPASPLLQIGFPPENGFLSREDLRRQMTEWLDELPSEPVLVKI